MPAASKVNSSSKLSERVHPRRSSRLRKPLDLKATVAAGGPSKASHRRSTIKSSAVLDTPAGCTSDQAVGREYHGSKRRRSQRIPPAELVQREIALLHKEQECRQRIEELDARVLSLSKKESEASQMMFQMAEREAQATVNQLVEHFTCALCYEILAHPYALNPGQCGHTFCAICILKWFFSRLHRACGGWHESVDCPICRSLLVITPDRVPRLDITFPFVPNRTAAAVCESLIEKLARVPPHGAIVKKEDSEVLWGSGSRRAWGSECPKKKGKSKEEDPVDQSLDVAAWAEGGVLRAEWLKKDREGKKEMNNLLQSWSTLDSQDFITLKEKLGV